MSAACDNVHRQQRIVSAQAWDVGRLVDWCHGEEEVAGIGPTRDGERMAAYRPCFDRNCRGGYGRNLAKDAPLWQIDGLAMQV